MRLTRHNILRMDGKGVAAHLDDFLPIKELNGIQWEQGPGEDKPILQWCALIEKIQRAGKGDLKPSKLDAFMTRMHPRNLYLCLATHATEEPKHILKKLKHWRQPPTTAPA
ncbi:MAG: hypothetical protein LBI02_04590 [Opitutaceae bacterium]|nr:hypothetical protein [Opitutaceae bacterium]